MLGFSGEVKVADCSDHLLSVYNMNTMQIAEKNRDMISGITGNMHDGYDIIFKDGHSCHCRTKKDVRSCIIEYCNEKGD